MLGQGWQKLNGLPRVSAGVESFLLGWSTCEEMWGLDRDVRALYVHTHGQCAFVVGNKQSLICLTPGEPT